MDEYWLTQEQSLQASFYFCSLAAIALWEALAPRRRDISELLRLRWLNHFGFLLLNTVILRGVFPLVGVGLALWAKRNGWGLFNTVDTPYVLAFIVSFLALDLVGWTQHNIVHRIPLLWRMHRTHHIDQEFDFTTSLRFHPFDSIWQNLWVFAAIVLLGAPVLAVLADQLITVTVVVFIHGNIQLPKSIENVMRLLIVTPEMHRIHHSANQSETDSNYATIFSFWDRLFGTYVAEPQGGHEGMVIGLHEFRERKDLTLGWTLINPFLTPKIVDHRDQISQPKTTM